MPQTIPVFIPSGQGLAEDYKSVYKSRMIAWASFSNTFVQDYIDVAGTEVMDGRTLIKPMQIHNDIGNPESAKYKFMTKYFFSIEDMTNMNQQYQDNKGDIAELWLEWDNELNMNVADMTFWIDYCIANQFQEIDQIVIDYDGVHYRYAEYPTENDRPVKLFRDGGSGTLMPDNTYYRIDSEYAEEDFFITNNTTGELIRMDVNINRRSNNNTISFYKAGKNITHMYSYSFIRMVEMLILIYHDSFIAERRSVTRTAWWYNDPISGYNAFEMVTSREIYNFNGIDRNDIINDYDEYVYETGYENAPIGKTTAYTRWFWNSLLGDGETTMEEMTKGMFYVPVYNIYYYDIVSGGPMSASLAENPDWGYPAKEFEGQVTSSQVGAKGYFVALDNLNGIDAGTFGYFTSRLLMIFPVRASQNYFQKFVYGIIEAFTTLLDAAVGLFFKIPFLKQFSELMVNWMISQFDMTYEEATSAYKGVLKAVMLTVISFVVPPLMGMEASGVLSHMAGGTLSSMNGIASMALEVSNYAMAIQTASMEADIEELKQQEDAMKRLRDPLDKVHEAVQGTMGSVGMKEDLDELLYNVMFNPFDNFEQAVSPETMGHVILRN